MPKHCHRNMIRPRKTLLTTLSGAANSMIRRGTTITPHARRGSAQRRRQNPRPTAAAAAAARVNIPSWAGSVQYEWSRYQMLGSQGCSSRRFPMRSRPVGW